MTVGKCPICGESPKQDFRPFCSRRCANIDLGRWLDGRYGIPTGEAPDLEPSRLDSEPSE